MPTNPTPAPSPPTLSQLQRRFTVMVAKLILEAEKRGLEFTFGEAYHTPQQAAAYAAAGTGIKGSLHCDRLAIDLNLFDHGVYQTFTDAYEPLGVWWESIGGAWGGRFGAGNHFSLAYDGRR